MAPKRDKGKGKAPVAKAAGGRGEKKRRRSGAGAGSSGITPAERAATATVGEVFPPRARRVRGSDPPPPRFHLIHALPGIGGYRELLVHNPIVWYTDQPRPHHAAASSSESSSSESGGSAGGRRTTAAPSRAKRAASGSPKPGRHTFATLDELWDRDPMGMDPYENDKYVDRLDDLETLIPAGARFSLEDDLRAFMPHIDEPGREASPRHTRGRSSSSSSSSGSERGQQARVRRVGAKRRRAVRAPVRRRRPSRRR